MTCLSTDLHERAVIDASGILLGHVAGVQLDTGRWGVGALRVQLRRDVAADVGAPTSFFHRTTIDVPVELVQSVGDTVLLSVDAHHLQQRLAGAGVEHVGA